MKSTIKPIGRDRPPNEDTWALRLHVAGQTPKSMIATGDLPNTEWVRVGLDVRPGEAVSA